MTVRRIDAGRLRRRFLVVAGILGAAVAVPLLDLYGRNPEVFVANRSSRWQIALLGVVVTAALPAAALLILAAADTAGDKIGTITYHLIVGASAIALGLVVARQIAPDHDWAAVAAAAAVAGATVWLHRRVGDLLRYAAWIGPAALLIFLVASPSARLLWESPAEAPPSTATVANPAPIVFIQLDEFPLASLLDADGAPNAALFPGFTRLIESSTWYRNALSTSIATTQSVPAALTGRVGDPKASPNALDHPENLFTLLQDDYDLHVIEWVTDLCPDDSCADFAGRAPARFGALLQDVGVVYGHLALPPSARAALPSIDNSWKGFVGQPDQLEAAPTDVAGLPVPPAGERAKWIDWMQRLSDGIDPSKPLTIHFAHLAAPHAPWQANPSGTHYERPEQYDEVDGVETGGRWTADPRFARLGFQRHLLHLGFLDAMVDRLIDTLETTGTWDDAIVVVVADHGASFVAGEHRRWPYEDNRDDLYRVPMIVKYPGQRAGAIVDDPAFSTDLMPTIVDVLGVDTDWAFDGVSLLDLPEVERPHTPLRWCCNGDGVSTDLSVLADQVRRNHEWVPDQTSWAGVVASGPHADLVGRDVAALEPTTAPGLAWSMENAEALIDADPDSGVVQTLLFGRVSLPDEAAGSDVAIAVNGVVAGTGFIALDGPTSGELRALIGEEFVAAGRNDVALLVQDDTGEWLRGSLDDLAVQYVVDGDRTLDIRPEGNRRIQFDAIDADPEGWTITGWAADIGAKLPADTLHVFVGERLVASSPPLIDNPNVVRWYKSDDLLTSGFRFELAADDLPQAATRITVVAEFGDVAVINPVSLPPPSGG